MSKLGLKYDIESMEISLKLLCASKVVLQVLEACDVKSTDQHTWLDLEIAARKRVRKLSLPQPLEKMVDELVKPIGHRMDHWYRTFGPWTTPILTPQGAVDLVKSTTVFADDDQPANIDRFVKLTNIHRYVMACEYCHEKQVFELAKRLSEVEIYVFRNPLPIPLPRVSPSWVPLTNFWLDAFENHFGKRVDGQALPQPAYDVGFYVSLNTGSDIAVKYFMDRASPEEVTDIILARLFPGDRKGFAHGFLPATYALLLSRLDEVRHRDARSSLSYMMLDALKKEPYGLSARKAVCTVTQHLDSRGYWGLMSDIAFKVAYDVKDRDYRQLLGIFWAEGSSHKRDWCLYKDEYHQTVQQALLTKDVRLMDAVLAGMSTDMKDEFLMGSLEMRKHNFCLKWIRKDENHPLLERVIAACGKDNEGLLVKFRAEAVAMNPEQAGKLWAYEFGVYAKDREWHAALQELVQIVNKIRAGK